jgi:hypothetical protein
MEDRKQYQLEYRKKNAEKLKKQAIDYRKANKEKLKRENKEYRRKNKKHLKGLSQLYYWENREKVLEQKKEYGQRPAVKNRKQIARTLDAQRPEGRWKILLRAMKMRPHIKIEITKEDFLVWHEAHKNCHFCGSEFLGTGHGIDRLDSSKNYFKENMVGCCRLCNTAKSSLSVEAFKEHIKRLYEHLFKAA